MSSFSNLWSSDNHLVSILIVVALVVAAALIGTVIYRLLFGHRLRVPHGSRARQPRLGLVDAFSLDGQRQLVLVRRDNVEHLIMIGGPNDVLVESQIVRAAGALTREPGLKAPAGAAPPQPMEPSHFGPGEAASPRIDHAAAAAPRAGSAAAARRPAARADAGKGSAFASGAEGFWSPRPRRPSWSPRSADPRRPLSASSRLNSLRPLCARNPSPKPGRRRRPALRRAPPVCRPRSARRRPRAIAPRRYLPLWVPRAQRSAGRRRRADGEENARRPGFRRRRQAQGRGSLSPILNRLKRKWPGFSAAAAKKHRYSSR